MRKARYGYLWATLALFLFSVAGHWLFGWWAYVGDARAHGESIDAGAYALEVVRDMLENWQSEFLQLIWQVGGLAILWHVGSPQSREGHDRLEEKVDYLLGRVEGGARVREELARKYPRA